MLFEPKMQLVWVNGPIGRLTDFLERCCLNQGTVHPARALDNMTPAAGYAAPQTDLERCCLNQGTVHPARALDNMTPAAGYAAPQTDESWAALVARLEADAGDDSLPLTHPCEEFSPRQRQLLEELEHQLAESDADLKLLNDQLTLCRTAGRERRGFEAFKRPAHPLPHRQ